MIVCGEIPSDDSNCVIYWRVVLPLVRFLVVVWRMVLPLVKLPKRLPRIQFTASGWWIDWSKLVRISCGVGVEWRMTLCSAFGWRDSGRFE